jgi:hypothetical protein
MTGKGGQTHGNQDLSSDAVGHDAEGRDVPDSKERSTEIAVEEGRKGRAEHPDNKP